MRSSASSQRAKELPAGPSTDLLSNSLLTSSRRRPRFLPTAPRTCEQIGKAEAPIIRRTLGEKAIKRIYSNDPVTAEATVNVQARPIPLPGQRQERGSTGGRARGE